MNNKNICIAFPYPKWNVSSKIIAHYHLKIVDTTQCNVIFYKKYFVKTV